jgi:F-type H+-transporting ATPase subunit epsilon
MNLKILIPQRVVVSAEARKVTVEAQNGSFCVLPHHVDFVAILVPSLLVYVQADGDERYLAIDEGVFVKRADEVLVSTRRAVSGTDVGTLKDKITEEFEAVEDRERETRSAVARLEADLARRFLELRRHD